MSIARHLSLLVARQSTCSINSRTIVAAPRIITFARSFHATPIASESELSKLRKRTGYAFALCRKALEMHEQDVAKAEKWLRAEALKQGWEKAQKVKGRNTGEGLIGIFTTPDKTQASMIEVKCETDFVAKNDNFTELATKLAERLSLQSASIYQSADSRDSHEQINKLWIVDEGKLGEIAGSLITEAISKLGENIRFVRGCIIRIQSPKNNTDSPMLLPYTHAAGGKIVSKDPNVILGKYGTIIAVQRRPAVAETPNPETTTEATEEEEKFEDVLSADSIDDVGTKLGQHIIGLSPLTVSPPKIEETEPESIENKVGDEESTSLLKQRFIFNDDITVEQFLKNSNTSVLDFVRFECGEDAKED